MGPIKMKRVHRKKNIYFDKNIQKHYIYIRYYINYGHSSNFTCILCDFVSYMRIAYLQSVQDYQNKETL